MACIRIALTVAGVAAAGLVSSVSADDSAPARKRRPPRAVVSDVRIGDGGVVVTTGESPNVEVRFRLRAGRRESVPVRFEIGIDRDSNGHVDEAEFGPASLDPAAPAATSIPRNRRRARFGHARFRASPEGEEHVAVWRARDSLFGGRFLAAFPEPVSSRPDAFGFVPSTRPVFRISPRRGTAAARAFEYDGNSAPVLTLESVEAGPLTVLRTTVADADSEDLNGDGGLDPLDGEDRNGDGILQQAFVDARAWWVRVPAGFDPSSQTTAELLQLGWRPCTLLPGPMSWLSPPFDGFAAPGGTALRFDWNADADAPGETGPFLVGMTVYDETLSSSGFQVFAAPVVIPR